MPALLEHSDDASPAWCVHCGALAVGPCARCDAPVCGDCCVLTEGGTRVWAICLGCDRRGGRSLSHGWAKVISWFMAPIVLLLVLLMVLGLIFEP